jgi:TP901 family phage tail tape measure protein
MALTVDEINVVLGADISGFQRQMGAASSTIQGLGGFAAKAGTALTLGVTAPILAMGKASVDAASNFNQSMADISALTGSTGTKMQELSALALKMGQDTTFSATEASAGMLELLKSGLTVEQVMGGGLKGALDLAAAGNISVADAAIVGSTALNAFKNDGLSMSDAADILAGAANASAADVASLSLGLSQASAVAAGVGLSFEDTTAALALFANNGLKGSDAGTSLKTMLLNLQPTTKEQTALFEKLGLMTAEGTSAFFDQQGKLKSLSEIAGLLQGSLSGMTDAQKLSTLETIFGSDAIRAANIVFKEGSDGVKKLKDQMANVSAEEVAKARMDSFKGSVEQMKGSLETAGIVIGDKILPILEKLAGWVKGVADWFVKLNPDVQNTILIFLGVAAAIGPVLLVIAGVSALISLLIPVAALLGTTIGVLMAAFFLVPLAIAAVIAIGVILYKHWDEIKAFAIKTWGAITQFITGFLVSIGTSISGFIERAKTYFNDFVESIKYGFSQIPVVINDAKDKIWAFIVSIGEFFKSIPGLVSETVKSIGKFFSDGWDNIIKVVSEFIPKLGTMILDFLVKLAYNFGYALGTIVKFFIELPGRIIGAVTELISMIVTFFSELPGKVSIILQNLWQAISDKWAAVRANTVAWLAIVVSTVVNFFQELPGNVSRILQNLWQAISDKWAAVKANTVAWWGIIVEQIANFVRNLPGTISGILQNVWQTISDKWAAVRANTVAWWGIIVGAIKTTAGGIYDGIVNALRSIPSAFSNIIDSIWSYITSQYYRLYSAASNIASGFWQGFKDALGWHSPSYMEEIFIAMSDRIKGTLSDLKSSVPAYSAAAKGISNAFTKNTGLMTDIPMTSATSMTAPMQTPIPTSYAEEGTGNGNSGGVQVSVAQLVVREEADILKIAQQLYRLQKDRTRGRGTR